MERKAGVLMHITSLPGQYGIGTMGDEARKFVDSLVLSNMKYWQILPLSQTGFGNSPYQSYSAFAGNPYLIDLDYLYRDGLLLKKEYTKIKWSSKRNQVDYDLMYQNKYKVLRIAASRFFEIGKLDEYNKFIDSNSWVEDYALFMAIKHAQKDAGLSSWKIEYKLQDLIAIESFIKKNKKEISFWKFVQFIFFKQWFDLKEYANKKGIKIIGDCPIYVSCDSCDVWMNPTLFRLDKNLNPVKVAGCPPDYFNEDGQLWGNPLYNWKELKNTNYDWWINRINHLLKIYDYVRIDHFRGLAAYYTIEAGEKTARYGKWDLGPGKSFIDEIKKRTNNKIIAEDLGFMTQDVIDLLSYSKYPGMNVLEFGFNKEDFKTNENSPLNLRKNSVVYLGTHDNETIVGWIKNLNKDQYKFVKDYLKSKDREDTRKKLIECLLNSKADTVILQAQDLLGLDNKARMNTPSTTKNNWVWRCNKNAFSTNIIHFIKPLITKSKRN